MNECRHLHLSWKMFERYFDVVGMKTHINNMPRHENAFSFRQWRCVIYIYLHIHIHTLIYIYFQYHPHKMYICVCWCDNQTLGNISFCDVKQKKRKKKIYWNLSGVNERRSLLSFYFSFLAIILLLLHEQEKK